MAGRAAVARTGRRRDQQPSAPSPAFATSAASSALLPPAAATLQPAHHERRLHAPHRPPLKRSSLSKFYFAKSRSFSCISALESECSGLLGSAGAALLGKGSAGGAKGARFSAGRSASPPPVSAAAPSSHSLLPLSLLPEEEDGGIFDCHSTGWGLPSLSCRSVPLGSGDDDATMTNGDEAAAAAAERPLALASAAEASAATPTPRPETPPAMGGAAADLATQRSRSLSNGGGGGGGFSGLAGDCFGRPAAAAAAEAEAPAPAAAATNPAPPVVEALCAALERMI